MTRLKGFYAALVSGAIRPDRVVNQRTGSQGKRWVNAGSQRSRVWADGYSGQGTGQLAPRREHRRTRRVLSLWPVPSDARCGWIF